MAELRATAGQIKIDRLTPTELVALLRVHYRILDRISVPVEQRPILRVVH